MSETEEHISYKYEGQNLICAVDIKTNGPVAGFHDLTELNILPLDKDFKRSKVYPPFHIRIYPKRFRKKTKALETAPDLYEVDVAYSIFESWFSTLNIRAKAKIVPLAHNWSETKPFLDDFLGHDPDGDSYTKYYFHKNVYKDIRAALFFLKDMMFRKSFQGRGLEPIQLIYGRSSLTKIMTGLEVKKELTEENYYHVCVDLANTYKKLIEIFPTALLLQ